MKSGKRPQLRGAARRAALLTVEIGAAGAIALAALAVIGLTAPDDENSSQYGDQATAGRQDADGAARPKPDPLPVPPSASGDPTGDALPDGNEATGAPAPDALASGEDPLELDFDVAARPPGREAEELMFSTVSDGQRRQGRIVEYTPGTSDDGMATVAVMWQGTNERERRLERLPLDVLVRVGKKGFTVSP